jgi:hypothetical protein
MRSTRKVVIDPKSGNGNMIYLPLDKMLERRTDPEANTITVRPPASLDSDSSVDTRQRVER